MERVNRISQQVFRSSINRCFSTTWRLEVACVRHGCWNSLETGHYDNFVGRKGLSDEPDKSGSCAAGAAAMLPYLLHFVCLPNQPEGTRNSSEKSNAAAICSKFTGHPSKLLIRRYPRECIRSLFESSRLLRYTYCAPHFAHLETGPESVLCFQCTNWPEAWTPQHADTLTTHPTTEKRDSYPISSSGDSMSWSMLMSGAPNIANNAP